MIKINGKNPETVELCNYILTRRDEGNSGYMIIWDLNEFQPYDIVIITQDYDRQFIIDKVRTLQKGDELIKQEIFLQDTIHYFDKIIPPSRRFTNNKKASDFLDIYSTNEKNKPIFTYESNYLLDTIMPQKEYDGENLTSIIKDIARRVNCKASVELDSGTLPIITFTPLTKRLGTTAIDYTTEHLQTEIESSNYATEVLGKVKNAVIEDGRGTWFPSKNYGIAPRTDEFRFDEATAAYILNDKIWSVLKVIIPNAIQINDGTSTYEVDLDVTNWVVSKPEWEYLNNPTGANTQSATIIDQSNTVYYQIGGDRIEKLWATREGILTRTHLANLYQSAIGKYQVDNPTHIITIPAKYEDTIFQIPFIINYVSQRDVDYVIEKMDVVNKYQATLLSNQLSTLVELNQHAGAMSLLAERVANKEITFKETSDGLLYRLGNWTTDDRIIVTVKREIDGRLTHQEVELAKNFANIDVETSVSRSPDPFQITDKQIKTNFQTKEFIEFSESLKSVDSYMDSTAILIATNIFNYNATYDTPIFDGQIIPTIPKFIGGAWDGKAIHIPLMTFANNTIGFHTQLFHPTFAGYTLEDNERGVVEYKRTLNGEIQDLETYNIVLGTENIIDDSGANKLYPLVTSSTGVIDLGNIYANLDPNCLLSHTHNISVVTDSPDKIILNGNFGFYNNLIRELNNPLLEVYYSNGLYNTFTTADKKVRLTDVVYTTGTINYNTTTRQLTITHPNTVDNVAIVYGDDIILALNGIDSCFINFGKSRTGLKGLGFYELMASANSLSSINGTANLFYVALKASAFNLSTISGSTGILEYTLVLTSLQANASGLATLTGSTGLFEYTGVLYKIIASATNLSTITGSTGALTYTIIITSFNASATNISNVNGSANLTIQYLPQDYSLSATGTLDTFTGSADLSYTYQEWDYIGTSGTQDGTVDIGTSGTGTCRSIFAVEDIFTSAYPPKNYSAGFIMAVDHSYEDPVFGTAPCSAFYFRNIEVTE